MVWPHRVARLQSIQRVSPASPASSDVFSITGLIIVLLLPGYVRLRNYSKTSAQRCPCSSAFFSTILLDSLTVPYLVYNTAMYTACAVGAWFIRTRLEYSTNPARALLNLNVKVSSTILLLISNKIIVTVSNYFLNRTLEHDLNNIQLTTVNKPCNIAHMWICLNPATD